MRAAWLLLLALGLPTCPGGCRCPGGAPPVVLPPTSGRNETLVGGGRPRAPDVAVLVAVGGWLGAVLLYVARYVRRSRAETRLHLEYLRALPCRPASPEEEEEEKTLSTVL
ncbi:leucine-rich repeat-containing protein 3B-like [Larus michahellis]|uniref:leucine-rich repeat-containing protein 3B-like n=1 Tax=Larus michahellis TaxID=119627 RepID=UPI003D9BE560